MYIKYLINIRCKNINETLCLLLKKIERNSEGDFIFNLKTIELKSKNFQREITMILSEKVFYIF